MGEGGGQIEFLFFFEFVCGVVAVVSELSFFFPLSSSSLTHSPFPFSRFPLPISRRRRLVLCRELDSELSRFFLSSRSSKKRQQLHSTGLVFASLEREMMMRSSTMALLQQRPPPPSSATRGVRVAPAVLIARRLRKQSLRVMAEPGEAPAAARESVVATVDDAPTLSSATPPTSSSSSSPSSTTPLRLTLETREARQTLRFSEIWDGEAPAIVVTAVASDSTAAEFGVVAGSRLLSLPHPTRKGEKWELKPGSAPLSRIKDLIRVYRGVLIDMEFSREPISDEAIEAWVREQEEKAREKEEEKEEAEGGARPSSWTSSSSSSNPSTTLATSSYDSDNNNAYSPAAAAAEREARALERRLRLRAERLAIDDARDDTKVVVGAAVAFLLPAAVILAIAYFSGYLDTMQANLS